MKRFSFIFVLVAVLGFLKTAYASEASYCTVIDSGNDVVMAEKVLSIKKNLQSKVDDLNKQSGGYKYMIDEKPFTKVLKTKEEKVTVQDMFDSEDEAINYFNNIKLKRPLVKGNYEIFKVNDVSYEPIKKGKIICHTPDCQSEILKLKQKLEKNQKLFYKIVIDEIEGTDHITVIYKNDDPIYFDTKEEALELSNMYKPVKDGFKFVKNEIQEMMVSEEVLKTYEEIMGNNNFDTEAEAKEALERFKDDYKVTESKIELVRDDSKNKEFKGKLEFDSTEEAKRWILDNEIDSSDGKLETKIEESIVKYDEGMINEAYSSKALAEEAVDDLKNQGYIVDSIITEMAGDGTGKVESAEKIDANKDSYTFGLETDYVLIKQGSGRYAVWTKEKLTQAEKEEFIDSYKLVSNDGSTLEISLDNTVWINGFGTFDLSFIGNNWGVYEFVLEENNIILYNKDGKISHVVYGNLEDLGNKYLLTGTKYKEKEVYVLEYTKIIYGFSYRVNAKALVKEKIKKYQVVSIFNELQKRAVLKYLINEKIDLIKYKLSYEKYIPVTKEFTYVNWTIEKCENNNFPAPPQTGVKTSIFNFSNFLILIVLFIIGNIYRVVKGH